MYVYINVYVYTHTWILWRFPGMDDVPGLAYLARPRAPAGAPQWVLPCVQPGRPSGLMETTKKTGGIHHETYETYGIHGTSVNGIFEIWNIWNIWNIIFMANSCDNIPI